MIRVYPQENGFPEKTKVDGSLKKKLDTLQKDSNKLNPLVMEKHLLQLANPKPSHLFFQLRWKKNFTSRQLGVKSAYLLSNIREKFYFEQSKRFEKLHEKKLSAD